MSTSVGSALAEAPQPPAAGGHFVEFQGSPFQLFQPYAPAGDQTQAIAKLVEGIADGLSYQTLLGVTGSGKTFTMANVIARLGRPAIVFFFGGAILASGKSVAEIFSAFWARVLDLLSGNIR